jgi:hypothetical protein
MCFNKKVNCRNINYFVYTTVEVAFLAMRKVLLLEKEVPAALLPIA